MFRTFVAAFVFALSSFSSPPAAAEFSGPVFGIAAAPNGNILAADAGAGVVEFDGDVMLIQSVPGITDISPIGRGSMWASRTGTDPNGETDSGSSVLRISNGKVQEVANLFKFEVANNPHPGNGVPASNPFDVFSLGGSAALVADAAANDLLLVNIKGQVQVVAVFPNEVVSTADIKALLGCPGSGAGPCFLPAAMPAQPVPTSVAVGPGGYIYVGELKGFPAPLNESRIWRIAPWANWAQCGSSPDCEIVFDGGFTSIIDLAFGPDGLLYVVELDELSWFAMENGLGVGGTINACDLDTLNCVEIAEDIPSVTAITFGKDGTLYSTWKGTIPGESMIIEIP